MSLFDINLRDSGGHSGPPLQKFMFNWKFIKVSTITFILLTVSAFFWHNNLFPNVYYPSGQTSTIDSISSQNVWFINFAVALLVYGYVYFVFRAIKPDTKALTLCMWGVYYNISAIGFLNFLALGALSFWTWGMLVTDMIWAVISGALSGGIVYYLYKYSK